MPKRRQSNRRRGQKDKSVIHGPKAANTVSSAAATAYVGPIKQPGSSENNAPIAVSLMYNGTLSSDSAGIINTLFSNNPNVYTDWASLANLFDEYRFLGIEVEFFPANRYSKATTQCMPGVGVVDRDDLGVLPSIGSGFAYESCKVLSLEDPWTDSRDYRGSSIPSLKMHMSGPREAQWITTATPQATGAIKIRFDGLSSSTIYGMILVRGLFQFRGRD